MTPAGLGYWHQMDEGDGRRRANQIANRLSANAAASENMWPASASNARELAASPAITSATI